MGVVWLGRHELLGRDVAVKFLLNAQPAEDDPGFVAFIEGARAAAALRHEGLNTVLHADVIQDVPFLVMDFVEGPTLSHLLRAGEPLPLPIVRSVVDQMCEAIGALHDHGVIHRDIKPANVLLTSDGVAVVTDFGLACARPQSSMGAAVGGVAGTPEYMAPEMFDRIVSARTDVYALGITAYECLAGRRPFDGDFDVIEMAQRESALPLTPLASVPLPVREVLERACAKNPLYRYKSARHLHRAWTEAFDLIGRDEQLARTVPVEAFDLGKARVELVRRISRAARGGSGSGAATPSPTPGATYYDRLGSLVDLRKRQEALADADASTLERAPAQAKCRRCGQDIAGHAVTGRCPMCLELIRASLEQPPASNPAVPPPSRHPATPASGQSAAPRSSSGAGFASAGPASHRATEPPAAPPAPPGSGAPAAQPPRPWWKRWFGSA